MYRHRLTMFMVQGSSYKMSDIEALNYIAVLQTQKTQLLKND